MKKAFRYNDEIVFYFDAFDNKYIAKGGSLTSRLNNPGLVLSRNLAQIGYHAIGAYHHYAIFSHPTIGKEALRVWFISSKYYQPRDPNQHLQQLYEFTGFSNELQRSRNVTLIDNNISGTWEHCLAIPSYQSVVREIIDKFHREGVKK